MAGPSIRICEWLGQLREPGLIRPKANSISRELHILQNGPNQDHSNHRRSPDRRPPSRAASGTEGRSPGSDSAGFKQRCGLAGPGHAEECRTGRPRRRRQVNPEKAQRQHLFECRPVDNPTFRARERAGNRASGTLPPQVPGRRRPAHFLCAHGSAARQIRAACTGAGARTHMSCSPLSRAHRSRLRYSVCSSVRMYSTTDSLQPSMCVHLP
jgi:hypothetical protein